MQYYWFNGHWTLMIRENPTKIHQMCIRLVKIGESEALETRIPNIITLSFARDRTSRDCESK